MKFFVGDAANGPFAEFHAEDEKAAEASAEAWGKVLDVVDWTDEDGDPILLFIVGEGR